MNKNAPAFFFYNRTNNLNIINEIINIYIIILYNNLFPQLHVNDKFSPTDIH